MCLEGAHLAAQRLSRIRICWLLVTAWLRERRVPYLEFAIFVEGWRRQVEELNGERSQKYKCLAPHASSLAMASVRLSSHVY